MLVPVRAVGGCGDGGEFGEERTGVGGTVGGVLGHPGGDQRAQRPGYRVQQHRFGEVLVEQPFGGVAGEGRPSGQALIEGGGGGVDVCGGAGGRSAELFGRGVDHGAGGGGAAAGAGGDAEVGQFAVAVTIDQDVLRSVVAVHHPVLVGGGQSPQRALQHGQCGLCGGAAPADQDVAERDAVDEFHDDGHAAGGFNVLIQPDHVRVIQGGQRGCLAAEQASEPGVGQQVLPKVLDGHQGARGVVPGQHHLAEPSRAQRPQPGEPGTLQPATPIGSPFRVSICRVSI